MAFLLHFGLLVVVLPICLKGDGGENGDMHAYDPELYLWYRHMGCYQDASDRRDLKGDKKIFSDNDPYKCIDHCKARGYLIAGVQTGKECYCDNSYGTFWKVSQSRCNTRCPGDRELTCGGNWVNDIYITF